MDPKPVYFAHNATEAAMVQQWLQDAGIESQILGSELQGGVFDIVESDPVIIVSGENLERAQQAVARFHEELQSGHGLAEMSDAEGQFNWPICPLCDELREATCDQCLKTSNEFSAEVDGDQLTVICLACSSPATVTFAQRCRYCQHDFEAADAADTSSVSHDSLSHVNQRRVLVVVVAMGILFLMVAVWFVMSVNA